MKQLKHPVLLICILLLWITDVSGSSIVAYSLSYNIRDSRNYYLCSYQSSKPDSVILKDNKTGKLITISEKVCSSCSDRIREDTTQTYLIFESQDSTYWYFNNFKTNTQEERKIMKLFAEVKPIFQMKNIQTQARSYKAWVLSIAQTQSLRWWGLYELSREGRSFTSILPRYAKTLRNIRKDVPALYQTFTEEEYRKLFEVFSSINNHSCYDWDVVSFIGDQCNQQVIEYIYSYFKRYLNGDTFGCYYRVIRHLEDRDKNEEVQKVIAAYNNDKNNLNTYKDYFKQLVELYDKRN